MIDLRHQEGLSFLMQLEPNSVDLVLTDPPYITSRDSGMNKWVDHIEKQRKDKEGNYLEEQAKDEKTEEQWSEYKTKKEWDDWFDASNVSEKFRPARLKKMKKDFIQYGSIYGKKYAVTTDYGSWDSEFTMEKLELFIEQFYRVLKPGGTCIVFFDLWKITPLKSLLEDAKFKQIRFIEWIKTNPQPINSKVNYLTNCREIALLGIKKSKPTFNSKYDNALYRYPLQGGKNRFHPTQKSLPLFEELIKKHSNPGDKVLDTFAGSATTAIAAINTGRNFIGSEISKEYYDKSINRIKEAQQWEA